MTDDELLAAFCERMNDHMALIRWDAEKGVWVLPPLIVLGS